MASNTASISQSREGARVRNPVFDMAPFALPSSFWNPSYVRGSLWLEHLPFCFWSVEAARPSSMVITGTADGVPHFALCEAALRLRLEAQCLAILHEQPATEIAAYNEERFCEFSRIEVASGGDVFKVAPSNIDLLVLASHGLEDGGLEDSWEAWLPKLSERAVVLVPRIEEASAAAVGWERVCNHYPHHIFHHGGGLGVVGVGDALPELFHHLVNLDDSRHSALVRAMFARLGTAIAESHRHTAAKRGLQKAETRSAKLDEAVRSARAERTAAQQELTKTQARVDKLQNDLEASQRQCTTASRALKLRTEHTRRVAAAVEVLKRDHEATKSRLFEARRLAARAEVESKSRIDQLCAELKRAEQRIRGIEGEAAGFRKKLKRERELHHDTRNELDRMLTSRSWAITAPFRKIAGWTRRKSLPNQP